MIIKISHQPINIDIEMTNLYGISDATVNVIKEMSQKMHEPFFFHFKHHGEQFLSIDANVFNIPHHLFDAATNVFQSLF